MNIALNQPISASSQWADACAASKANNGSDDANDNCGGWSPSGNDPQPWLQIDLGSPRQISAIELVTRHNCCDQPETRQNFEIRASNDPNFASYVVLGSQGSTVLPFQSTWTHTVTDPNGYRYIRATKAGYFFIAELRVLAEVPLAPSDNLALNRPASASSQWADACAAQKANNGSNDANDNCGGWSPSGSDTQPWWQVDLGQAYRITTLELVTRHNCCDQPETRQNFEIRASNDPSFGGYVVLGSQGSTVLPFQSTWTHTVTDPNGYRYIRATKAGYFFIAELKVYGSAASNQAPTVTLTSPTNNATYTAPATLTLSANASDADGSITKVEFYNGASLIGTDSNGADGWAINWAQVPAGSYTLSAKAYDNTNASTTSPSVTVSVNPAAAGSETVWVEDAVPNGAALASDAESWNWISNPVYSGSLAHTSGLVSGLHQHYFYSAAASLSVATGDRLFAYVYLDPANPPSEVMLQWNDGGWNARAYWGANLIGWGTDGTNSRRYMGPLPSTGQWVRLEVPASQVGLEGKTLNGMAFTLFNGKAIWDKAGKVSGAAGNQPPTVNLTSPTNNATYTAPATITLSANATDADGSVAKVEFYNGASLIATDTNGADGWSVSWASVPAGSYTLSANAYDNTNLSTSSASVTVSVTSTPSATNLALNRPANASSQWADACAAAKANNGSNDVNDDCGGWSPTGSDAQPWWQVDLGQAYRITTLELVTRHNCCDQPETRQNFEIRASNDPSFASYVVLGSQGSTVLPFQSTWTHTVTDPNGYRYIRATKAGYFFIAELKVYGSIPATQPANNLYYIYADHLNTPRVITDTANTIVWRNDQADPFAASLPNEDPDGNGSNFEFNLRFPGQYYDKETGLHYNYHRSYDPNIGKYTTADPLGLMGGDVSLYVYGKNNPLSYIDPLGLMGNCGIAGGPCVPGNQVVPGVFGCLIGCTSYAQGDAQTQASIQATIGGGIEICEKPRPKKPQVQCDKNFDIEPRHCGIYDPNCDNKWQFPGAPVRPKQLGFIIGGSVKRDGRVCVQLGLFGSLPLPSIELGGLSE